LGSIVLIAGTGLAPGPALAETFVIQTSQVCTSNAGDCETAPSVVGPGLLANLTRSWSSPPGYSFLAETSFSTNYCAFSGFARASGYDIPETGTEFNYSDLRIARSFGSFSDVLTAGSGGAPGFFRIPLHVVGTTAVSWQNGDGYAQLVLDCVSNEPGSPFALGHCPTVQLVFRSDDTLDTVVDLDVPIVLGSPFQYRVSLSMEAWIGHAYGDATPFQGASEASFATAGPFVGATVLDAGKQPIPGAPISASESGFDYAPEPAPLAGGLAALLALGALARPRGR